MSVQRKKPGYRWTAILLSAALLTQPAMTARAAGTADGVRLKECSALGKLAESGDYASFKKLDGGYIETSKKDGDLVRYGILDQDGKEILPCTMDVYEQISDHIIVIGVLEKETTDKNEAMFFRTNRRFAGQSAQEGETMYTGYKVAYDLARKKELSFTKVTKPGPYDGPITVCGDSLYVAGDDGGRKIYDMNGKVLSDDAGNLKPCTPFYVSMGQGATTVYNSKLEKLFDKEANTITIAGTNIKDGTCMIFMDNKSQKYGVLDTSGKELAKAEYDYINPFGTAGLLYLKKDKRTGLMNDKGKIVIPCEYDEIRPRWEGGYGYAFRTNADGKQVFTLIGPEGILLKDSADSVNTDTLIASKESGTGYDYFLLKDKAFSLKQEYRGTPKNFCVLEVKDPATNKVGLIETISGKQLLDTKYDKIESIYGYVFAYLNGKCTAYRIDVP